MEPFPHHYHAAAEGGPEGPTPATSPGLPDLDTAPPAEYDGPGGKWSPETLLVAAAADCMILTFRAVARASNLEWEHLSCEAEGVMDKVDGTVRFTEIILRPVLTLPDDADAGRAARVLDKAKRNCLITGSLLAEVTLEPTISTGQSPKALHAD